MNRPFGKLGASSSLVAFMALAALASLAACGGGTEAASTVVPVVPGVPSGSSFSLSSAAAVNGTLPADYTCDGSGSTPALSWLNAPSGTTEFALLMTTLPGDGSTK